MRSLLFLSLLCLALVDGARAESPPLLPEATIAALADELSGETAKRNLEFLAREHRMRGSRGYRAAAEFIAGELASYGLTDVILEELPADGEIFYGTQRSRRPWDAQFAELWDLRLDGGEWRRHERLASWDAMPVSLAQDSESADLVAELVDVGEGTSDSDYEGRDVRGRIVLAGAQPGAVADLAVDEYGAVGIVSYAPNQRSAWWKEDDNLVRWGHLESFRENPTFAFMISLKRARALQERLNRGEPVRLEAKVDAGQHAGNYNVLTAVIPGDELAHEEIVFSCHLDHQRPGANDNASGSVAILEIARSLAKLIEEGRIERPARSLRFVWPPEIEGTLAYLAARPEIEQRMVAAIHLDMVGGGPETKAVFHITRGPASLPSFINDVAESFGDFVNRQSLAHAYGQSVPYPLVAPEGGKEPLLAQMVPFSQGSDHQIYSDGSFAIPSIYMNDWPDRYIHTNGDSADKIDPTKLKRASFIAAASGLYLAELTVASPELWTLLESRSLARTADLVARLGDESPARAASLRRFHLSYESELLRSAHRFTSSNLLSAQKLARQHELIRSILGEIEPLDTTSEQGSTVYRRNPELPGPMWVFGYHYLRGKLGEDAPSGGAYNYELLNLIDGRRSVAEIADILMAIHGPIPAQQLREYLDGLQRAGVIHEGDTPE